MMKRFIGAVLDALGWPGIVRECNYGSEELGVKVVVKKSDLFTTVTVNGLDVYFDRITGAIDGIGFNPAADCSAVGTRESAGFDVRCKTPQVSVHTQRTLDSPA